MSENICDNNNTENLDGFGMQIMTCSNDEVFPPGIIDLGSHRVKTDYADHESPRGPFPPVFGRYIGTCFLGADIPDYYYGDELIFKCRMEGIDEVHNAFPIDGTPWDFTGLGKILYHTIYRESRFCTEEIPIIMTSLYRMNEDKFKFLSEYMFEEMETESLDIWDASVLALVNSGETNGVVLESGAGITQATPILDLLPDSRSKIILENQLETKISSREKGRFVPPNYPQRHGYPRYKGRARKRISGDLITDLFEADLYKRYPFLKRHKNCKRFRTYIVEDIKLNCCFLSLFDENGNLEEGCAESGFLLREEGNISHPHYLPDGEEILKIEKGEDWARKSPEILFDPTRIGYSLPGVHKLTQMAIKRCGSVNADIGRTEVEQMLYDNILLFGGSTMIRNFPERFSRELRGLKGMEKQKFRVNAPEDRINSAWLGGKDVVSSCSFLENFVTLKEFKEHGYRILMKRCIHSTHYNDQIGIFQSVVKVDEDLDERNLYVQMDVESHKDCFEVRLDGYSIIKGFRSFFLL